MKLSIRAQKGALVLLSLITAVSGLIGTGAANAMPAKERIAVTDSPTNRVPVADYLSEISSDGIYRWLPERLPVRVFMEDGSNVPGYQRQFRSILASCFDEWASVSRQRLSWELVNNPAQADIVCRWTDYAPELSEGTEAGRTKTYTQFDTSTNTGTIKRATMTLLTQLPDRPLSFDETAKAYLHEVGHAFGLAGHSPNRTDIMAASVSHSQNRHLSSADVATINRLYKDYPQSNLRAYAPQL